METKFRLGHRLETKTGLSTWEELSFTHLEIDKPVIFVLGGDSTHDSRWANGYTKLVRSLIQGYEDDVDVYAIYYEGHTSIQDREIDTSEIVDGLINNLLAYSEKGELDFQRTLKNFRRVNFFTHCYGDVVTENISRQLRRRLMEKGLDEKESKMLVEQMFVISYGIVSNQPYMKSMSVISPYDQVFIEGSQQYWKFLLEVLDDMDETAMSKEDKEFLKGIKKLKSEGQRNVALRYLQEFYEKNQRCFVIHDKNDIMLAVSALLKKNFENSDVNKLNEHVIHNIRREEGWKINSEASETSLYLSLILGGALKMSAENSRKNELEPGFTPLDMAELAGTFNEILFELNHTKSDTSISLTF